MLNPPAPTSDKELYFACTLPELIEAFAFLHCGQQAHISELTDLFLMCVPVPDPKQRIWVGNNRYDPRRDNITKRWIQPHLLTKWILHLSNLRGQPYSYSQARDMVLGKANYG